MNHTPSAALLLCTALSISSLCAGAEQPDAAALASVLETYLNGALQKELVDPSVDPSRESPIQVRVLGFVELRVANDEALATVSVVTKDLRGESEGLWAVAFSREKDAWTVARIWIPPPAFGLLNYAVVAIYLLGMLAIGWWTSRHIHGTRGFFIAEGKLNYVVVGISIMTTYLSAITMMALSASAFSKKDWTWAIQLPFLVFTAFVITRFVLPRYREAGVISVYQYLEQRIHVSSRVLASVSFIVLSVGRMGIVLYLPALAFHIITGFSLLWTIIISGAVVTIYTVMGGIEAVIWTDVAQAFFIVAGAVASVVYMLVDTGLGDFARVAAENHKFRMLEPGFPDFDITKVTALWLILETIFQTIRIYGTQQDMTQRYMTTPSTRKAQASVWIAILAYIPLGYAFYFMGTALFAYYVVNPSETIPALIASGRSDAIYPYFVASKLPPGMAGLVVAAIFAAAMSSIDACMNSSSTVCIEDFYRRFSRKEHPDSHYLSVAQWLTLAWGVLATLMAIAFMEITNAQNVWSKIMSVSTTGVLGLMALAFLPFKVSKWAAIIGFLSSCACLGVLMFLTDVNFLLWPVIGNLAGFSVALLVNAVVGRKEPDPARN